MEKEEFLKILPKLIREDDEVKGAIITALSGVVATKDDIKTVIEESNKRFEAMDKRFEELIQQMNKGFEEARKDRKSLKVSIATMSSRSGEYLEDAILNLLSDKLIKENLEKSKISRESLVDPDGRVYYKDYNTNIDMVVQNGKIILIEIKYRADNREIFDLLQKGKLFKLQFKKNYDRLLIVCLEINQFNFEQALKQGVHVIAGKIIQ